MSNLRDQLREYYARPSLSTAKLEAILAQGRATGPEGSDRPPRSERKVLSFPVWVRLAAVAVALFALGLLALWRTSQDGRIPYGAVPPGIVRFFSNHPVLEKPIQDKAALHRWLVDRGAPAQFLIPAPLQPLESSACQVIKIQGRPLYLSCYWRDQRPNRNPTDEVHLVVGPAGDFTGAPAAAKPEFRSYGGWSFAGWRADGVVYTLATPGPAEVLPRFVAQLKEHELQPSLLGTLARIR